MVAYMTSTTNTTDSVLNFNLGYINHDELRAILAGTECVTVGIHAQKKGNKVRVVVSKGVRDTDGGFWLAGDPEVFYATPSRNFNGKVMTAYFAKKVAPGLPVETI